MEINKIEEELECESEENNEDLCNLQPTVDKNEFNRKMHELVKKHGVNTKIIPEDYYRRLIEQMIQINLYGRKSSLDFRRSKKYAIIKLPNGEDRLFYKPGLAQNKRLMMVTLEETYDIIHKCHIRTNHGGRTRMMDVLRKKYYNVTTEGLMLFLSLCSSCSVNRAYAKKKSKELKARSTVIEDSHTNDEFSNDCPSGDPLRNSTALDAKDDVISQTAQKYPELYSRAQMDLLSVTNEPSEEYKYLMVYRNYCTKFIHLKAMAGISVDEAAEALLDIFLVFGAPNVLQSKNGVAILKPICNRISSQYPDFKVVYSENIFPDSTFQGKSNEDILKKLNAWLVISQNTKWQNGVKYIQHSLNTTFHETICRTPSELVFGRNPSKGISSFIKNTENIFSESDLLTFLDSRNGQQDSEAKNNLLLTESLIMPKELIKLEVVSRCEDNVEEEFAD